MCFLISVVDDGLCATAAQTIFCFTNLKLRVMSKHFQKILKALKTSDDVKALGFDKDEIKRLASSIDKKLNLEDDASDEDVENAIEEAVDNALPYLKMAQSTASRIVKKKLAKVKKDEDDDDEDDDDDDGEGSDDDEDDDEPPVKKNKKAPKGSKKQNRTSKSADDDDETKTLLKSILKKMDKQDEVIAKLKSGNVADKRRSKLEKLLKDTGTFGKRYLRQFDKMNFEDDDEFDEFLDEIKEDLEETNQERANAGLEKLGLKTNPEGKKDGGLEQEVEALSDDELKELADQL